MTSEQLRGTNIGSVSTFNKMLKFGWCDSTGRSKLWFSHQSAKHDEQFAEEREKRPGKRKFVKKGSERQETR